MSKKVLIILITATITSGIVALSLIGWGFAHQPRHVEITVDDTNAVFFDCTDFTAQSYDHEKCTEAWDMVFKMLGDRITIVEPTEQK